jgi:hypothetical protein
MTTSDDDLVDASRAMIYYPCDMGKLLELEKRGVLTRVQPGGMGTWPLSYRRSELDKHFKIGVKHD